MAGTVYLDNSATTPICEEALARYCEVSRTVFGNPSSLHAVGKQAEDVLKGARLSLLSAIGAKGGHIAFLASGTEANSLALWGRAHAKARYRRGKILASKGEHASVSQTLAALREEGFAVEEIPTVGGALDMAALEAALTPDTFLVSVMAVNNETGAVYPLSEVSRLIAARAPDCLLHVDATQALFHIPLSVSALGIDLLTVSAHKVEGPKGVGALYYTERVRKEKGLVPQILGGGQEDGMRSGTENVPGIAAFAAACDIGKENFAKREKILLSLRQYLLRRLAEEPALREVKPLLPPVAAPHILTLILPGIKSEVMLHHLSADGISVSSGSACSSHGKTGSSPLLAFGCSPREADTAIRVSLSHRNTEEELALFLASLERGLARLSRLR